MVTSKIWPLLILSLTLPLTACETPSSRRAQRIAKCEALNGVYVRIYKSRDLCLTKEAFIGFGRDL